MWIKYQGRVGRILAHDTNERTYLVRWEDGTKGKVPTIDAVKYTNKPV